MTGSAEGGPDAIDEGGGVDEAVAVSGAEGPEAAMGLKPPDVKPIKFVSVAEVMRGGNPNGDSDKSKQDWDKWRDEARDKRLRELLVGAPVHPKRLRSMVNSALLRPANIDKALERAGSNRNLDSSERAAREMRGRARRQYHGLGIAPSTGRSR
ncbi:MAG: hypothetical protein PHO48_01290 [Candidatus Gracilibacteria bacterium]|nr:hypothetical protein [Candidatus Gracilibacteria bacterium]MDD5178789.1 hypothetical protein [Candidatus Gracilibacteria bacterium]